MRKLCTIAMVAALAVALFSLSALAATHSFNLPSESSLAGINLAKGKYKIKVDGDQASIIQNNRVVARITVEVREAKVQNPGTVLREADGSVKEIRLKNQVITVVR